MAEMTVSDLIKELSKIEDKTLPVRVRNRTGLFDHTINAVQLCKRLIYKGYKNEKIDNWVRLDW